jgi:hypothetical protein
MKSATLSLSLLIAFAPAGGMAAQAQGNPPPRNTIDCHDWTHNPDGSWRAHADAKPFDLGDTTNASMQSTTIGPQAIAMGGVDLWTALNQKCGAKR